MCVRETERRVYVCVCVSKSWQAKDESGCVRVSVRRRRRECVGVCVRERG